MEARLMITPAGHSRNFILLLMLMQIMFALLVGGAHAIQELETISEEENLEMERQLKVINKPPIKSFRTEHGDILDCIDIYKQHALDHPLLKDHKIQAFKGNDGRQISTLFAQEHKMPTRISAHQKDYKGGSNHGQENKSFRYELSKKFWFSQHRWCSKWPCYRPNGYYAASAEYTMHNFGAKATMNVWNPSVSPNQLSFANIWIENGPLETFNVIQAGWGVQPSLFSSNYTRLLTDWTADGFKNTGCYNYLCPGFVQVSSEISLGLVLKQISTYNGTQADIELGILRDGEWWLKFYNKFIGYWPQKLFSYMYGGANFIFWGGVAYSPAKEPSPAMGSGHFPKDGHDGKPGYFKQLQIWDNVNFVYPDANSVKVAADRPECYDAEITREDAAPYPMNLFYGGPGQCKW